jgi:uncharacterized protein (TIGR02598 family)
MQRFIRSHSRRLRGGFSLPEVTLAVAIASVGLTSTLGLMPKGLDTLRKAGDTAAQARIVQQISGMLSVAQWQDTSGNDLLTTNYNGKHYYFDDMAAPLDATANGAATSAQAVYVAEVFVQNPDINLPQSSSGDSGAVTDSYLRRALIRVAPANTPEGALALSSPDSNQVATFSSVITRQGQ